MHLSGRSKQNKEGKLPAADSVVLQDTFGATYSLYLTPDNRGKTSEPFFSAFTCVKALQYQLPFCVKLLHSLGVAVPSEKPKFVRSDGDFTVMIFNVVVVS